MVSAAAEHRWFLMLVGAVAILRVLTLVFGQRWADGDESVVGVMALHVLRDHEWPTYYWGQPYAGGSAIEACLAAVLFRLVGASSLTLKAVPLLFSLATLVLTYVALDRTEGRRTALSTAIVLAVASPLVEWNVKARGGYSEVPFFIALMLFFLARRKEFRRADLLGLGITVGLSYYSLEVIVPLLIGFAVYCVALDRRLLRPRALSLVVIGTLIGLFPCLHYNYENAGANFRYVFGEGTKLSTNLDALGHVLLRRFPAFFQAYNVDAYPKRLGVQAYLEASMFGGLACTGALMAWRRLRREGARPDIAALCACQLVVALPFVLFNQRTAESPRYFLPPFVPMLFLTGFSIAQMLAARKRPTRLAGLAVAVLVVGSGLVTYGQQLQRRTVNDDIALMDGRVINTEVPGESVRAILARLTEAGIDRVRAPYFLQWRLIFESRERIIASSAGLHPSASRRALYDDSVAAAASVAIVVAQNGLDDTRFARAGRCHVLMPEGLVADLTHLPTFHRSEVDPYVLYIPVAERAECGL
jgi:4-amino-4-deoxy-L-arabinose transferase-like glycosyltransferase